MQFNITKYNEPSPEFEIIDRKRVNVGGAEFDEAFLCDLLRDYFTKQAGGIRPTITTAYTIYLQESGAARRRKFSDDTTRHYNYFIAQFGDMYLDELRHYHAALYRDTQLARGLNPSSVRKHISCFNAMLNMAFRYLGIDRLSPFRSLSIPNLGLRKRSMPLISEQLTLDVKARLLELRRPNAYVGLIQLNTGCRLSEPLFALREDLVLDHEIPHLWIRPNELSDRKTRSSIRAIPLVGVSLKAAKILNEDSKSMRSKWLVPLYAKYNGNGSCSAIMNKNLRDYQWRSHMFRHAFIDRLKACGDIPTKLAESITGHGRATSDFDTYGTVGYTLEQKLRVIERVAL